MQWSVDPWLRNQLMKLLGLSRVGRDQAARSVTPWGVGALAILPAISWLVWEPALPFVLGAEALWVGVWLIARSSAAWRIFEWGFVVAVLVALYWFVFGLA